MQYMLKIKNEKVNFLLQKIYFLAVLAENGLLTYHNL